MSSFGQKRQRRTNRNCQSLRRRSDTVTREEIEKRIDDLALNHAARHEQDVKAELEKIKEAGCENGRAATLGTVLLVISR